jgi:hypothetical protein
MAWPCIMSGTRVLATDQAMTVSPFEPLRKPAMLKLDPGFQPCPAEPGDELYPNGIFEFNITRLLTFIHAHLERFPTGFVELVDIEHSGGSGSLDEAVIDAADLSRPILLAEIAPGRYNVIDGNHRVAKARREGVRCILAYRVRCPEHVVFLTSTKAYETYVEYWNSKLDGGSSKAQRTNRRDQSSRV